MELDLKEQLVVHLVLVQQLLMAEVVVEDVIHHLLLEMGNLGDLLEVEVNLLEVGLVVQEINQHHTLLFPKELMAVLEVNQQILVVVEEELLVVDQTLVLPVEAQVVLG